MERDEKKQRQPKKTVMDHARRIVEYTEKQARSDINEALRIIRGEAFWDISYRLRVPPKMEQDVRVGAIELLEEKAKQEANKMVIMEGKIIMKGKDTPLANILRAEMFLNDVVATAVYRAYGIHIRVHMEGK